MRALKLAMNLMIVALSFIFFQCTSDYQAIPGVDGTDGIDGIDGVDGIDGSNADAALCIDCHSSSHRDPIINAWADSGHGSGGSWARGTSTSCAQCHNNEGFIDYLSNSFFKTDTDPASPDFGDLILDVNGDAIPMVNPNGYAVSNPISCTGCHTNHKSFDFENDGFDHAVRNIDPVKLDLDPTLVLDFSNSADELGLSNLCITCHQPRTSYPIPTGTADVTITSFRYGPHHGPQATLFEGVMGANIAGSTGYPGVASSTHRTGASCTSCHMGQSDDMAEGGHSWAPSLNACTTCHDTMTAIPSGIGGFAADFETLENLLIAGGYINSDGYVLGPDGERINVSELDNALTVPVKTAQAIWNYKTIQEDKSNGLHNPAYTRALLKNSIEALQQP
jgi:hypothetical protein